MKTIIQQMDEKKTDTGAAVAVPSKLLKYLKRTLNCLAVYAVDLYLMFGPCVG